MKRVGTDFALHLEMRFATWKREHIKNTKKTNVMVAENN
jgi:hypothetical protein